MHETVVRGITGDSHYADIMNAKNTRETGRHAKNVWKVLNMKWRCTSGMAQMSIISRNSKTLHPFNLLIVENAVNTLFYRRAVIQFCMENIDVMVAPLATRNAMKSSSRIGEARKDKHNRPSPLSKP